MNTLKSKSFIIAICFLVINILGCGSSIKVRSTITPASNLAGFQYSSIKKVAVLPFENYTKKKDAEKSITSLLTTELLKRKIFEVEDLTSVLKWMYKLDFERPPNKDTVRGMSKNMKSEALMYNTIDAYDVYNDDINKMDISISFIMYDTKTGDVLWTANAIYSGGITPKLTPPDIANEMIIKLVDSLESYINMEREKEVALRK